MSAQALERALSDKVRAVILNSPGHPPGAVYSSKKLASLAELLRRKDVWIISDDVYQRCIFDSDHCPSRFSVAPDLSDHIIKTDIVSKLYGIPGWLVGLIAADQRIATAVTTLNSNSVSNILPIVAAAAFGGDQAFSYAARDRLLTQRHLLLADLWDAPYIKLAKPAKAFYLFMDIAKTIVRSFQDRLITDDEAFCQILLDECGFVLILGSFLDAPSHARLSHSGAAEQVDAGVSRLKEFLSALS